MKVSEIEEGKLYSDGKSARVILWIDRNRIAVTYATSRDNFYKQSESITLKRFARWAKYPCTFELQVGE